MKQYNRNMGEYNPETEYQKNDVVTFDGEAYYRTKPGKGISPKANARFDVWKRLNQNLTEAIFLSSGLPTGATAYQQLVTDGTGAVKWEDRSLKYKMGQTITWDGNTDGLNEVMFSPLLKWYHVSDLVPSKESVKSSNVSYALSDSAEYAVVDGEFDADGVFTDTDKRWCRYAFDRDPRYPAIIVLTSPQRVMGLVFGKAGVWFLKSNNTFLSSFSYDIELAGLPIPDGEADNGKVLGVEEGKFKLVGASCQPLVFTAADNNGVLSWSGAGITSFAELINQYGTILFNAVLQVVHGGGTTMYIYRVSKLNDISFGVPTSATFSCSDGIDIVLDADWTFSYVE